MILKTALEEARESALDEARAEKAQQLIKLAQQQPELGGGIRIELDETIVCEILASDAVPDFLRHSPLPRGSGRC